MTFIHFGKCVNEFCWLWSFPLNTKLYIRSLLRRQVGWFLLTLCNPMLHVITQIHCRVKYCCLASAAWSHLSYDILLLWHGTPSYINVCTSESLANPATVTFKFLSASREYVTAVQISYGWQKVPLCGILIYLLAAFRLNPEFKQTIAIWIHWTP